MDEYRYMIRTRQMRVIIRTIKALIISIHITAITVNKKWNNYDDLKTSHFTRTL